MEGFTKFEYSPENLDAIGNNLLQMRLYTLDYQFRLAQLGIDNNAEVFSDFRQYYLEGLAKPSIFEHTGGPMSPTNYSRVNLLTDNGTRLPPPSLFHMLGTHNSIEIVKGKESLSKDKISLLTEEAIFAFCCASILFPAYMELDNQKPKIVHHFEAAESQKSLSIKTPTLFDERYKQKAGKRLKKHNLTTYITAMIKDLVKTEQIAVSSDSNFVYVSTNELANAFHEIYRDDEFYEMREKKSLGKITLTDLRRFLAEKFPEYQRDVGPKKGKERVHGVTEEQLQEILKQYLQGV